MKRYFLFVTICYLFISVLSVGAIKPPSKVIVIDPGHGGIDPGTTYKNIYEKDITLKISKYIKEELEKKNYIVYLTREDDYDLSSPKAIYRKKSDFDNRIKYINNYADYYVSIHLNFLNDSRYKGIQVFSLDNEKENASIMQNYLNKKLDSKRINKQTPSSIYMYKKINKPGLLIECGFLSNNSERNLLITEEYQRKIAKEIANGLSRIKI